ncbi:MAG: N-acetyltransferase [Acidobacteria bacterium]|nr:MAG: N-acetyltransferase [Acidobacteriota bacterium]REK01702.1 MAG: N-acetyltransferase [Acidobacteriota bacterium]REK14658.1 MAG: N-acetyltransferase [Acidobacteriota bacterium]REK45373.1 MAG: N-acetyltransferase [Acidobacteriota bacterium]
MEILEVSDGLELLPVAEENLEKLHAVVVNNFEHLRAWMPWTVDGYSLSNTRSFIAKSTRDFSANESMNFHVIENGEIVGALGLNYIDKVNKGTELGYWLSEHATGRGIITRCVKRLTDFAFEELGMHRVVIRAAPGNIRSCAVPERLGFTKEGTLREAEWLHDRFVDLVVYAMLKHEWDSGSMEYGSGIGGQ